MSVAITYTCDACGATSSGFNRDTVTILGLPTPDGWILLRGKHICPAHEVSIVPRPGLRNTPAYPGQRPCNLPHLRDCTQVKRYKAEHVGRHVTFDHSDYEWGRRYETVTGTYTLGTGLTLVGPVTIFQPARKLGPAHLFPADWRPKYEPHTSPLDTAEAPE